MKQMTKYYFENSKIDEKFGLTIFGKPFMYLSIQFR